MWQIIGLGAMKEDESTLLVYLFISLCKEATIAASNVAKHWVL